MKSVVSIDVEGPFTNKHTENGCGNKWHTNKSTASYSQHVPKERHALWFTARWCWLTWWRELINNAPRRLSDSGKRVQSLLVFIAMATEALGFKTSSFEQDAPSQTCLEVTSILIRKTQSIWIMVPAKYRNCIVSVFCYYRNFSWANANQIKLS